MVSLIHTLVVIVLTFVGPLLYTIYKRKAHLLSGALCKSLTLTKKESPKTNVANKPSSAIKTKSANSNGSPKGRQVHFAETISVSSVNKYSSSSGKNKQDEPISVTNTQKASGKKSVASVKYENSNIKTGEANLANGAKLEVNNNNLLSSEPPADELDSSVLLEVFNPTKAAKKKQAPRLAKNGSNARKRHSSDSNQNSYSSEQLFKMIAASSLSRDEVEMAVETLLNKFESGETDWQKRKSDPLQRLKNQLRDSEAALATECQNHEQTRARLVELKSQLQNERSSKGNTREELAKTKKDLAIASSALERAHNELSKQRLLSEKTRDEQSELIGKLETDNARLQNLLASSDIHHDELNKLRHEFNENVEQLHRYEAANDSLKKRVYELEANVRTADVQLDRLRADKQNDDYEACAKISELDSNRASLEKALKDHIIHLNEVSEANKLLEKSLNDAKLTIAHKEDVIKRLSEERHVNETSMKRTLFEMEQELRQLHERLSTKMAGDDERFRQELNQFERELTDAGQREQKLNHRMKQLREGLSELFPDLQKKINEKANSDEWVHHYLVALRQLTATVDKLRHNNVDHDNEAERSLLESPSKKSIKSSLSRLNGRSSRVGSPASNGRSSRASTNPDHDKRLMETKLVEMNQCDAKRRIKVDLKSC